MTLSRTDLDLILPFLHAEAEGKTIEIRQISTGWTKCHACGFYIGALIDCVKSEKIRIKPESTWRAWTMEEVKALPVDTLFKMYNQKASKAHLVISDLDTEGDTVHFRGRQLDGTVVARCPFGQSILDYYEHSTDHGVTWKKCGIEIKENK